MYRNTQLKLNLSLSPSTSSSPKDAHKKSKIFVSPNRYASLSEEVTTPTEVFSPPLVSRSLYISTAGLSLNLDTLKSPPIFIKIFPT